MDKPDLAGPAPRDISDSTDAPFNLAAITFAMGDAPEIALPAALDMQIAPPPNNIVDSNRVFIGGSGPIRSFGQAYPGMVGEYGQPYTVTKKITYQPDPGQTITLQHNPPALTLLGGVNRDITGRCFGEVQSDENGNWEETRFTQDDVPPTTGGGALIAINTYTASTTITIPAHATRAWIRLWGGAGGSGDGETSSGLYSGGTGAPGYLEKFATGLVPGRTLIYTRGNGGAPGAAGTAGILASGTQTIGTLTANGSLGSTNASTIAASPGTDGGTATGGDINIKGQHGSIGTSGAGAPPGGANALARGTDGAINGVAGLNGGLVIAWYNDAVF
jgi:hypothetical protein